MNTVDFTLPRSAAGIPGRDLDTARFARLTASERRVLTLLAHGMAPKQAAWELHVAISTVRSHIAAAKRKSGARTLQQLVGAFATADLPAEPSAERTGTDALEAVA